MPEESSNDDLRLTLAFVMPRLNFIFGAFMREIV